MPSNNCHVQTATCMLIAAALDASCRLTEGADVYVTSGLVTLNATEEIEEGTDYSAPNAAGQPCGPEVKADDRVKWLNIEGEMCLTDWALMSALSGNSIVVDAEGNIVGYDEIDTTTTAGICSPGSAKPRFALTLIRAAATGDGGCVTDTEETGATPFVATTFPNTTNWKFTRSAFENARQTWSFTARGYKSPEPLRGPLNLRPSGVTPQAIPTSALSSSYFVDPDDLPDPLCGVLEHPEPIGTADPDPVPAG